jgi:cysteinyl-tRNA synthetase
MPNPLAGVKSWLYHLGDVGPARAAEIGKSKAELVVIDHASHAGAAPRPYTAAELETMRGANDKLVVSYISVGEAEDYRSYWKAAWDKNPPSFLSASNPEWPDNFKVKYWNAEWQKIIFAYVDKIVKAGFNGLYLDIIDAFQYWEEVAPNTGINYRKEMAAFVAAIRDRAEATLAAISDEDRTFVLIGQNGEELAASATYLAAVDGIAKEDLRFYYPNGRESSFKPVPNGWFEGSKEYIDKALAKGVEVFAVEYMTQARQAQYASLLEAEIAWLKSRGIPLYVAEDRDLTRIYDQPAVAGGGSDPSGGGEAVSPPAEPPIEGTDGADALDGTGGRDVILGHGGADVVQGRGGADWLLGGLGADTLRGGAGDDAIDGGAGRDVIGGGAGADTLAGGSGADAFVFAPGAGGARITDFELGVDRLEIIAPGGHQVFDTADGIALQFEDGRVIELVGVAPGEADAALLL